MKFVRPMPDRGLPKISVAMGVRFRRESTELLERSVDSILAQTCKDFELLVCDDGSTQAARECLNEYARRDKRICLLRPGNRLTLPEKLNECLRYARGEYLARMDDDDISHPERFAKQLAALESESKIGYVGCSINLIRAGKTVGVRDLPEYPDVRDFFYTSPFVHPALMFRVEVLKAVGGYCEEPYCNLCEDYELLMRLYAQGYTGKNLQERLLDYTLPSSKKKNRSLRDRWHEARTRYRGFRELGALPKALPYVLKPIAAGLLPQQMLEIMRAWRERHKNGRNDGC